MATGPTGLFNPGVNERMFTRKQAAFIKWCHETGRLNGAELGRVFKADPSIVRKCAAGVTYADIGEEDL
jgi:hypothetical protein